ncbi:Uncharacterised protein [Bordetella pertussis]|nr:Uncharacterised protein [Bordetella pertussis]
MRSAGMPRYCAMARWSAVWNCSPFQISQRSSSSRTRQFSGSMAACARYGYVYSASMTLAAPAKAASMSPLRAAMLPGRPTASRYRARMSALPWR